MPNETLPLLGGEGEARVRELVPIRIVRPLSGGLHGWHEDSVEGGCTILHIRSVERMIAELLHRRARLHDFRRFSYSLYRSHFDSTVPGKLSEQSPVWPFAMNMALPVPAMLSQLLVAFTIEHDNEWELRYWANANPAPFRASLVMWANLLRFVSPGGVTVEDVSRKAGYAPGKVHPDLAGMLRWRYVELDDGNPKKPKLNDVVRPTVLGMQAAEAWRPLVDEIESRWTTRFGPDNVNRLKKALFPILVAFDRPLPHYYPVLDHRNGMRTLLPHSPECNPPEKLALPYLLSQALHVFAVDAEQISDIPLAIRSNVMRVLDAERIAKKDLPGLSGISKEAVAMSITYLKKNELLLEEPSPTGRGKVVKLTPQGIVVKREYPEVIGSVEKAWLERIPSGQYAELRSSMESLLGHEDGRESPLFQGLVPPAPNLWRAKVPKPEVLPHHPMVLHRGGWPDGS